jgi:AcrR family transcriptional regulator
MKEEIIETSLSRFLKYGIRKMTIQTLVSPLGISTKTVYKYFRDKEDLLKECLKLHYSRVLDSTFSLTGQYPNAVVALLSTWNMALDTDFGVNKVFYHDINHYYPALQDEILKSHGEKISSVFVNLVKEGIEKGYFLADLQPRIILESFTILYTSITRSGQFKKFRLSPKALANQTILVYLRGICTQKGLKHLTTFQ